MVCGLFGIFINGFWAHLVHSLVVCISKWLKRRGGGGFGQVVDFGPQVVDFGSQVVDFGCQNRKISIFFLGPKWVSIWFGGGLESL